MYIETNKFNLPISVSLMYNFSKINDKTIENSFIVFKSVVIVHNFYIARKIWISALECTVANTFFTLHIALVFAYDLLCFMK